MDELTVALLQLRSPGADPDLALSEGEMACREAARLGADLALFPEMWQIGYASWDDRDDARSAYAALATETDGPFVGHFSELARELEMAIVITYLQRGHGEPRNAATVIDRQGRKVLTYAKVHTCDFDIEALLEPGSDFPVADLEPLSPGRDACNGRSVAFSGICYGIHGHIEHKLVEAGEEEGVVLATFDLAALRGYRRHQTWADAYRKTSTYKALVADTPAPIFKRPDSRR
jgi:predicted amidohydrolase